MEALKLATAVHPLVSPKYVSERESFLGSFTVLCCSRTAGCSLKGSELCCSLLPSVPVPLLPSSLWAAPSGCLPRRRPPLHGSVAPGTLSSCRSACRPAPLFRVSRVLSPPSALDPRAHEALPRCPRGGVTRAVQPQALPGGPFRR